MMMMTRTDVRLWILSDLHVELTKGWDLPAGDAQPDFNVMVVAGDLIPRAERGVRWLLERVADRPVIYVAGNHEYYGADLDRTIEKARAAAIGTNVHFLQHDSIRIGDVTFAGATTWTDFDLFGDPHRAMAVAAERMVDFRKIRIGGYSKRFRPTYALARHMQARAFFEAEMRRPRPGKLVVISHHAPHPGAGLALSDPPSPDGILSAAYRSDLTALMRPAANDGRGALKPADLWIYGHTHESEDRVIGATRVVSNAKGYGPWPPQQRTWDNLSFDPNCIVEI
ncbi:metallophosphoesterase [Bradyrhizobium diazoefficiens]|uniref:metallophosphoesterase n=2 Tax=Bradyrhizobium TaxID=374 RepID=UPI00272955C0|nr:metallophosphoesterase [Bradyrhizobium diazoefficiens]WLA67979.1 metallophosphoesterase [Bradyrhizobium diazoefficiens]